MLATKFNTDADERDYKSTFDVTAGSSDLLQLFNIKISDAPVSSGFDMECASESAPDPGPSSG